MKYLTIQILFWLILTTCTLGCIQEAVDDIFTPVVTTASVSNVMSRSAIIGGTISSDGGSPITTRGIVYSTSKKPTISSGSKITSGSGVGTFEVELSDLEPTTTYYARAFATNSSETAYGSEESFTTLEGAFSPLSFVPENGATNVPIDQSIVITFSENLDISTVTDATFFIKESNSAIRPAWEFTIKGKVGTIKTTLKESREYEISLSKGIKSTSGKALEQNISWKFTTIDKESPAVISRSPGFNASNVSVSSNIVLEFSESIAPSSVNSSTFQVKSGSNTVSGQYTTNGKTVTFNPSSNLAGNQTFNVTLNGIADLSGNKLSNYSWSFTTESTTTLSVNSWTPGSESSHISVDANIIITFSDNIDSKSVSNSTVYISTGGAKVAGSYSTSGKIVTFTPSNPLVEFETTYTLTIKSSIQTTNGSTMAQDYSGEFTTIVMDPAFLYYIVPFSNGDKVLDSGGSDNYFPTAVNTRGNYSGMQWNAKAIDTDYFTLTSRTGGDNKFLYSSDGSQVAFLTSPYSSSSYYSGQKWKFVYSGYVPPSGNYKWYYMQSAQDNKYLSVNCKVYSSPLFNDDAWRFERIRRK
ncbi:Ig-like domain-containing protein [Reichenbachiella agarivorans]|uniref:Ig-like domain-containing protein n=1 Tax=Reichenbachiella agarivorans TaxID=2979464 RepID=A0ABY6CM09_9BACT|nr:Ig-like domain-containing protein [Reichenbachiella agarivorans]UXP31548.1 Ig-like domain-containing protein [Reichenbachiella agarivorans]